MIAVQIVDFIRISLSLPLQIAFMESQLVEQHYRFETRN